MRAHTNGQKHGQKDGQTDGRYHVHYLPRFAVDNEDGHLGAESHMFSDTMMCSKMSNGDRMYFLLEKYRPSY